MTSHVPTSPVNAEDLAALVGDWAGENAFRLMPMDPPETGPATAVVSASTLAYTWVHPADGPQSGQLDLVEGPRWRDTWHQPDWADLSATDDGGWEYLYGGDWRWQLRLGAEQDQLRFTMTNVVGPSARPDGQPVEPYEPMVMELGRA